jgi:NAD(P)-dependent dehydrogenase (short-subunit alcohol dehydrogenase family)
MPWDVATQVVVLSSPKLSGHVTGHVLMVEGGMEGDLLD